MSEAAKRGRSFELEVAKILRSKLGARVVRDPKSGAGSHHKSDLKDFYGDLPFDFELKDHEKLNIKASMRQAIDGASMGRVPVLAFRMDELIIASLKLDDLVSMQSEIQDLRKEVALLRQPIESAVHTTWTDNRNAVAFGLSDAEQVKKSRGAKTCGAGHITNDSGFCMQKGCRFSRGYRPPKGAK